MNQEEKMITLLNVVSSMVKKNKYYVPKESYVSDSETYRISDVSVELLDDGGATRLISPVLEVLSTVTETILVKGTLKDVEDVVAKVQKLTAGDKETYFE